MRWIAVSLLLGLLAVSVMAQSQLLHSLERAGRRAGMSGVPLPGGKGATLPMDVAGVAEKLSKADTQCVICQYLVERIKGEMLMNGINGGIPFSASSEPLVGIPSRGPGVKNPATLFTPPPATGAGDTTAAGTTAAGTTAAGTTAAGNTGTTGTTTASLLEEGEQYPSSAINQMMTKGFHIARRDRNLLLRHFEPPQIRYANMYDGPQRAVKRAQERFEDTIIQTVVYKSLEKICERHMPQPFYHTCFEVIRLYENIAQGLRWNDRPAAICQHIQMCSEKSYIAMGPHELNKEGI